MARLDERGLWARLLFGFVLAFGPGSIALAQPPAPLLAKDHPVDWWFAFKLNAHTAPEPANVARSCPFGGLPQTYPAFSQDFAVASSDDHTLKAGAGLLGTGSADPLGATFGQIYGGAFHYLVWNDQFYSAPAIAGCAETCGGPWGHSKGFLAWDDQGAGVVVQVTTPSWPGAGSAMHPRQGDGNTLGCVKDNDVLVSQHFFALRLTHDDVIKVLHGLANASVVTNPKDPQLVGPGGPPDVQVAVAVLGQKVSSVTATRETLSSGVVLISKPSNLKVPPWQMVSALLGGVPLRAATWWASPWIYSTEATTPVPCWSPALGAPGAVQIATTGQWQGASIGLQGGLGQDFNHAKLGVSLDANHPYVVFGDMNQQGALAPAAKRMTATKTYPAVTCASSQNGRGGLFYVVEDAALAVGVTQLIAGDTAPLAPGP